MKKVLAVLCSLAFNALGVAPASALCTDPVTEKSMMSSHVMLTGTLSNPSEWVQVGSADVAVGATLVFDEVSREYEKRFPDAPYSTCETVDVLVRKDAIVRLDVLVKGNSGDDVFHLSCKALSVSPTGDQILLKEGRCFDGVPTPIATRRQSQFSFAFKHDRNDAEGDWQIIVKVTDAYSQSTVDVPINYHLGALPSE